MVDIRNVQSHERLKDLGNDLALPVIHLDPRLLAALELLDLPIEIHIKQRYLLKVPSEFLMGLSVVCIKVTRFVRGVVSRHLFIGLSQLVDWIDQVVAAALGYHD